MEAASELDDDVFFKDLSKQISLLIMDDEDEHSPCHCPSVNLQAFSQAIPQAPQASYLNYDQQASKREIKGTGVFIPRSSNPRRKNTKQLRSIASGNKLQRPRDQSTRGLPHVAYSNGVINPSHDNPFNHRRF